MSVLLKVIVNGSSDIEVKRVSLIEIFVYVKSLKEEASSFLWTLASKQNTLKPASIVNYLCNMVNIADPHL